jgi:hypothetical protein
MKGASARTLTVIVCLLIAPALLGCGGGEAETSGSTPHRPDPTPTRYRPGGSTCRPHQPSGTVTTVDEDVIGSRAADIVACFGRPVSRRAGAGLLFLFYRERNAGTYWRFIVRDGRIVAALGNVARAR